MFTQYRKPTLLLNYPLSGLLLEDTECADDDVGAQRQKRDKEYSPKQLLGQALPNPLTNHNYHDCWEQRCDGKGPILGSQDFVSPQCECKGQCDAENSIPMSFLMPVLIKT